MLNIDNQENIICWEMSLRRTTNVVLGQMKKNDHKAAINALSKHEELIKCMKDWINNAQRVKSEERND